MTDPLPALIRSRVAARVAATRGSVLLNPVALRERLRERHRDRRELLAHEAHLEAALEWLERAQDASPGGGIARGYGMAWIPYMGCRGWQPPYPEITGYIIPTFYEAAGRLADPRLADRATRAARWLLGVQMPSGAIPGGVISQPLAPAAFNTGQVVLGWLAAREQTEGEPFAAAARRACDYLAGALDVDGQWPSTTSPYALGSSTLYNARTGWALAEAGVRLGVPGYLNAAACQLRAVAGYQLPNGWIPNCCLNDPERPLLHTIAYAIRGLVEGGRLLGDDGLVEAGMKSAAALASCVRADGWMPGRFARDWTGSVTWSCLTGQAQMASVWMRIAAITGQQRWLEPVPKVLGFLLRVHDVAGRHPDLRGGVRGSWPVHGGYGPYEVFSWATKFLCDALMRWADAERGAPPSGGASLDLA